MTFSTIPLLFAAQVLFLFVAAAKARARTAYLAAFVVTLALAAWGLTTATMATSGIYDTEAFLRLMPGLWLSTVPFLVVALTLLLPPVRAGLLQMADAVPHHWFVAIQALRVLAIGTLIKTIQGDFPLEVELAIGITDFAFGLSAVWLFAKVRRGTLSHDALMMWHIVGVLIIVLPGGIAMQSGLPGPWRVFHEYPTSQAMLDWPMVLAPSLVVPIFLLLNIFAAVAAHRARARAQVTGDYASASGSECARRDDP
ncbi:hypothetical protein C8N43_0346 [Litoreibacter ponti]|uniref:Uncharacterized protein n=1 Tax=Litoreibacter ponti TaxID=1510457 RepID=A0A2T6BI33_9RHOB|nr:hypothetical protein [Litoreibacter ponti]PTX55706.1 hypothetical protein C8N43_0346 [Litoreibacter ponti]